jgi:hypothetical protein
MPLDFFRHANPAAGSTVTTTADSEASKLSEAERALQELAEVFLQQ